MNKKYILLPKKRFGKMFFVIYEIKSLLGFQYLKYINQFLSKNQADFNMKKLNYSNKYTVSLYEIE